MSSSTGSSAASTMPTAVLGGDRAIALDPLAVVGVLGRHPLQIRGALVQSGAQLAQLGRAGHGRDSRDRLLLDDRPPPSRHVSRPGPARSRPARRRPVRDGLRRVRHGSRRFGRLLPARPCRRPRRPACRRRAGLCSTALRLSLITMRSLAAVRSSAAGRQPRASPSLLLALVVDDLRIHDVVVGAAAEPAARRPRRPRRLSLCS